MINLAPIMNLLRQKGFWTLNRQQNLIIAPPLIINKKELENSLSILDEVLVKLRL